MDNTEHEAKFWLPELLTLRDHVIKLGGTLQVPRHLERNLRFDTPKGTLTSRREILRLRQAGKITLTYKQPGENFETRSEWEVEVDNFEVTRKLLEGLGYEVFFIYEKYREVFGIDRCRLMLDEVPYGSFAEVEGPTLRMVEEVCDQLGLDWTARIQHTYLELFQILSKKMEPKPDHATFDAFTDYLPTFLEALNLQSGYVKREQG